MHQKLNQLSRILLTAGLALVLSFVATATLLSTLNRRADKFTSNNAQRLAALTTGSGEPASPVMNDEDARQVAYAAASDDEAAVQQLETQASGGIASAEYGLGFYYATKAQALVPLTVCAPSTDWFEAHQPGWKQMMDEAARLGRSNPSSRGQVDTNAQARGFCDQAVTWLDKAASVNDSAAEEELGHEYYSSVVESKAVASFLAKMNDASAATMAAGQYEKDRLSKATCSEALRWLNAAANRHDSAAEYDLGLAYLGGAACVARNEQEGKALLARSAADGNEKAKVLLATLERETGKFSEARRLIAEAEQRGATDADTASDLALYFKTADTDDEKAQEWQSRADAFEEKKERKYPIFKLIDQKFQASSTATESNSDQSDGDSAVEGSSAASNLSDQDKIALARGMLCGQNDLLNQIVNSGHVPGRQAVESLVSSIDDSMQSLGFSQDEAHELLRGQLVSMTQGGWSVGTCPIYEQQADRLIAMMMK